MNATTYGGAAVLIALLPILPLAMYLRRRGGTKRGRMFPALVAASLALLGAGVATATSHGLF
jgi:hypothetical protein